MVSAFFVVVGLWCFHDFMKSTRKQWRSRKNSITEHVFMSLSDIGASTHHTKKHQKGNVHRLGTGGKIRISVVNVTSQRYATHKHYLLENMKQKCDALWYHNQEYFQLFLRKDLSTHEFLDFFREDWNKFDFHNISGNLPLRLTQKHGLSKARVEKNQTQFRGESIS